MESEKEMMYVAGDIEFELQQIEVIGEAEDEVKFTDGTGSFLTIYCCAFSQ